MQKKFFSISFLFISSLGISFLNASNEKKKNIRELRILVDSLKQQVQTLNNFKTTVFADSPFQLQINKKVKLVVLNKDAFPNDEIQYTISTDDLYDMQKNLRELSFIVKNIESDLEGINGKVSNTVLLLNTVKKLEDDYVKLQKTVSQLQSIIDTESSGSLKLSSSHEAFQKLTSNFSTNSGTLSQLNTAVNCINEKLSKLDTSDDDTNSKPDSKKLKLITKPSYMTAGCTLLGLGHYFGYVAPLAALCAPSIISVLPVCYLLGAYGLFKGAQDWQKIFVTNKGSGSQFFQYQKSLIRKMVFVGGCVGGIAMVSSLKNNRTFAVR